MFDVIKQLVGKKLLLSKLELLDRVSDKGGQAIFYIIIFILAINSFFALNIFLGFWIGYLLNQVFLGFLIVFLFYFIVTLIFLIFKKSIITKFQDKIIESYGKEIE